MVDVFSMVSLFFAMLFFMGFVVFVSKGRALRHEAKTSFAAFLLFAAGFVLLNQ